MSESLTPSTLKVYFGWDYYLRSKKGKVLTVNKQWQKNTLNVDFEVDFSLPSICQWRKAAASDFQKPHPNTGWGFFCSNSLYLCHILAVSLPKISLWKLLNDLSCQLLYCSANHEEVSWKSTKENLLTLPRSKEIEQQWQQAFSCLLADLVSAVINRHVCLDVLPVI